MSTIFDKNNSEIKFNKEHEKLDTKIISLGNNECKYSKYSILSLLIKRNKKERKYSIRTTDSSSLKINNFNYEQKIDKKFDEFNKSLSDISDFDLEKEEDNKSDFNSSEDDDNDFEEEIVFKSRKQLNNKNKDETYGIQIDLEFENILKELKIKKSD